MPPTDRLPAFALTATIVIAIPGPSVLFAIGQALARGRRAAVLSVAGNSVGEYVQVVAVAAGVGALAVRSATAGSRPRRDGSSWSVVPAARRSPQSEPAL